MIIENYDTSLGHKYVVNYSQAWSTEPYILPLPMIVHVQLIAYFGFIGFTKMLKDARWPYHSESRHFEDITSAKNLTCTPCHASTQFLGLAARLSNYDCHKLLLRFTVFHWMHILEVTIVKLQHSHSLELTYVVDHDLFCNSATS